MSKPLGCTHPSPPTCCSRGGASATPPSRGLSVGNGRRPLIGCFEQRSHSLQLHAQHHIPHKRKSTSTLALQSVWRYESSLTNKQPWTKARKGTRIETRSVLFLQPFFFSEPANPGELKTFGSYVSSPPDFPISLLHEDRGASWITADNSRGCCFSNSRVGEADPAVKSPYVQLRGHEFRSQEDDRVPTLLQSAAWFSSGVRMRRR
ncbi:unnamed protein product [Arctogadus glacialis]